MFVVDEYLNELITTMKTTFGARLLYVGLQGSYLRGEATENSDIDVMVVLKNLSVQDLKTYREIISQMEDYEKSCGFICGSDELVNWNPFEICHLLHTTKNYYGELEALVPKFSKEDVFNFIKISVGNLYHELCHRYVHGDEKRNYEELPMSYKQVFFILQNIYWLKTGDFVLTKKELLTMLDGIDKEVMLESLNLTANGAYDFDKSFEKLFLWSRMVLMELELTEK